MFRRSFNALIRSYSAALLLALLMVVPSPAQDSSSKPQSSSSTSTSSSSQQPQEEQTPEAGGPNGSVSPIVVPKKTEQPPPPPKPKVNTPAGLPTDFSLKVDVPLVTVPVLVTTKHGDFIPGLKKDNFKLLEDGVPQQIKGFTQNSDAPITVVMLVEFAAKNYQFIYDMLNNAYGFAQSLKPNDWVAVISYDMHPEIQQDFTQNKESVVAALNRMRIPGFSETNLYDALYDTLDRLDRIQGHKYILLISSGVDTFSKLNLDKTLKKVKATKDVTIFTISTGFLYREMGGERDPSAVLPGMTDRLDYLQADNQMRAFANMTGGKAYQPRFLGNVPEIVGDIANTIRNQYVLSYYPSNPKQDGSYRHIKIELVDAQNGGPIRMNVNGKPEKDYKIMARDGYTARHEVE